ncbi:MAG: hypothetical protein IJ074_08925 [Clostridia bacterium]|nr:hypothetical protein [Clostridia bacterium]
MKKRMRLTLLACIAIVLLAGCEQKSAPTLSAVTEGIDIDLSVLSNTVIYSQIDNMLSEPWNYLGKTVRIKGALNFYVNDWGDSCSSVLVADATACCSQGIEFVWKNDGVSSDFYPSIGDEITVTGRFETYERDGSNFIHLVDADVAWETI